MNTSERFGSRRWVVVVRVRGHVDVEVVYCSHVHFPPAMSSLQAKVGSDHHTLVGLLY
jgi:hypothetical protein